MLAHPYFIVYIFASIWKSQSVGVSGSTPLENIDSESVELEQSLGIDFDGSTGLDLDLRCLTSNICPTSHPDLFSSK